ncbi:phosphonate C-P lyase system protein PhnK [Burkholderia cepacia]|uniref:phosphonate C-P lyase system protein PhnK n=1 Tax=Burkholderia cepacia TaxID=292 RepID=UPI002AB6CD42|nr:phosphonate C-P lyase system protein PhnK [Burkholderia cepacia]
MTPVKRELLRVEHLSKNFDGFLACSDISFSLRRGEILGIVGESGSGKTTLLRCLAGVVEPDDGSVKITTKEEKQVDLWSLDEATREQFLPTEVSLIHQNPRDGLRLDVSAGGNIAEPLMAAGGRHYESLRSTALEWLDEVEIESGRINDLPQVFSGGMQKRLQIARGLTTHPSLVLMDEPTGGLDVSVQARLLDLLRGLVRRLGVAAVIVTHDLAVVRLLADRLMVMQRGKVVEAGLTDQVLDDPHHPYTQLLVSSVLQV